MVGAQYTVADLGPGTSAKEGTFTDLGTLGGPTARANGINNVGQIVGVSRFQPQYGDHGFIWQRGVITDLNSLLDPRSGWTIIQAHEINDSGQIAALGFS